MKPHAYDFAYIENASRRGDPPAIRPEILAAKLQAIRDLKYPALLRQLEGEPRLAELLWFLQAMAIRPGGLVQFVKNFLTTFPERLGTDAMRQIGWPPSGHYRLEQCLAIWSSLPSRWRSEPWKRGLNLFDLLLNEELRFVRQVEQDGAQEAKEIVNTLTPDYFWRVCVDGALDFLPGYLAALCNEQGKSFVGDSAEDNKAMADEALMANASPLFDEASEPRKTPAWLKSFRHFKTLWFFERLSSALFEMMDQHAQRVSQSLAPTAVTKMVFRELDFSWTQKVPVALVGDSRFGKTKSVAAWCDMWPGRARLVTVPDSSRERDFFKAHADALGISYTDQTPTAPLKDKVEFVLRHSALACVYDESHFLIPVSFTRTTPPKRLNWIRCQVIDLGLPCAFFATPQSSRQTLAQFVKTTGYNMEQWLGRIAPTVILPTELAREELLAVAKIHFPDISGDYLELIAAEAMLSPGYLQNMEFTAKRARFIAQSQGRPAVTLKDVQDAIEAMLPALAPTPELTARRAKKTEIAAPLHRERKPVETPAPRLRAPAASRFSTVIESPEAPLATNLAAASLAVA